jgi:orotate phosphoribosyltransferase
MALAQRQPAAATSELGEDGELFEFIRLRSFRTGDFTLSSGVKSDHYFDLKPTMMSSHGNTLAAEAFLRHIAGTGVDYVGGLEMGAVPIVGGLAVLAHLRGVPISTFFVRKAPKGHGTKKLIEGLTDEETLGGKRVLVVDDVATKGHSLMQAVSAVREQGAVVDTALVLLDREEGAEALLRGHGVRLVSVFRGHQFL